MTAFRLITMSYEPNIEFILAVTKMRASEDREDYQVLKLHYPIQEYIHGTMKKESAD